MKAIFFEKHGGVEVLKYADVPDPEIGPGEALIKVRAVALNHLDIWVRRGWRGLHLDMPHISGSDVAGEIVSVSGNSKWQEGQRVIIYPGVMKAEDEWTRRGRENLSPAYKVLGEQMRGGMAEYVVVPAANLFALPDEMDFTEGAAPLLVGTTCWRMLFKCAGLRAGQSVLIVGAGGGVNSLATVIAIKAGAQVYCLTSSKEKMKKAEELGAHHVINYKDHPNWHAEVLQRTKGRGVDIVVDNVGEATINKSLRAATRGGRIVTVGNTSGYELSLDNRLLFTKQLSLMGSTMGSRQDFIDCMNFMLLHQIKPIIDRVEPLSQGIQMLKYLEEGNQFGKIVLTP